MSLTGLIFKELRFRKWNFLFAALGVAAASALFTAFYTASSAAVHETRRVTRDMGFNIRIISSGADLDEFWAKGYSEALMPESTLEKLSKYKDVFMTFNHLVATLQQRVEVEGKPAILHGISATVADAGKKPMGYRIQSGELNLGHRIAARLQVKKGGRVSLLGKEFKVAAVLAESGTDDDIRIYGSLADIQSLLGKEGRINEIQAIDCLCLTSDENPLEKLRAELEKALPEARVFQIQNIANARAHQRQMIGRYFDKMSPVLIVGTALWLAVLSLMNVRDRRYEIGLMRALGEGTIRIALLFQGKAALVGLAGGAIGAGAGAWLAVRMGPSVFKIASVTPDAGLMFVVAVAATVFSAVVCLVPSLMAATQDPAEILKNE